jgi:3'-phosphoadenosine 5'-phosphosulfate sulfotransferase (PAPS reductase)/FAD synthetase
MNNLISFEEYKNRLNWTLPQKIDHTLFIIENALTYSNNNAYISFSGGKDSTVLFYLAKILKKDIKGVFFNTTNEFPEIYENEMNYKNNNITYKKAIEITLNNK